MTRLLSGLRSFLSTLHKNGVYFRGINFSNTVITPDNQIGLIDIGSVVVKRQSLSCDLRARNMKHPLRYKSDQQLFEQFGIAKFIDCYVRDAEVNESLFYKKLSRQHRVFKNLKFADLS